MNWLIGQVLRLMFLVWLLAAFLTGMWLMRPILA